MPHHRHDHRPATRRPVVAAVRAVAAVPVVAGVRVVAAVALVGVLVGCSPTGAEPPADRAPATAAASPTTPPPAVVEPATPVPDVPVRSASLDAVDAAPAAVPPASLAIPSLGIALPVDPVGVEDDGQMEIPPLAERAGWYRYGAAPGASAGTAVVAAHVDSVASAGLGPFARLPEVRLGAVVDVTLADGTTRQYAVTDVTRQAKPEVSWADVFVRDGGHRLVLVTCGGTFQREVGHYSDNVIVTAEPLGG